ncbi:response regulator transcription factor [Candidatus Izimaplasma bacterium]|nr:response regulator transcription factor [Candidatus Izimaplasma bacterium]
MDRILLVEDNKIVSKTIERKFQANGFIVDCCFNAEDALLKINDHIYSAVILDLNLPKMSGYAFLQILRKKSDVPVIVNTAHANVKSRVKLINVGASDFIEKSFEPDEIVESIKVIIEERAKEKELNKVLTYKTIEIELMTRTVKRNGEIVDLTSKEFDILKMLIDNPDRAFSRKQLYLVVWGEIYDESVDNTINVHVKRLRNKIEVNPKKPDIIATVYAFGYRLGNEVVELLKKQQ